MDCNSIVYDAYRKIQERYIKSPFDISDIESMIINDTIIQIRKYISLISPEKKTFITFDGVAPFAKMVQQRKRRYKSLILGHSEPHLWDTANITPGMPFMRDLNDAIKASFKEPNIILSCSDEKGEGEHKIFAYLRANDCREDTIAIYGLDSDLIMLSLFNLYTTKNIFIFRESPNFKTVITHEYNTGECLFMDIASLHDSIYLEMYKKKTFENKQAVVKDYVIMCFLLGNDFLPHISALNIRKDGIYILFDLYKDPLLEGGKIQWRNIKQLLQKIDERGILKKELIERRKFDRPWKKSSKEDIDTLLLNAPVIYRIKEEYINPNEAGWEDRYRRSLNPNTASYMVGIEWVYNYYSKGQISEWHYEGKGGPLLTDIISHSVPDIVLPPEKERTDEEQLLYIMPKSKLPKELQEKKRFYLNDDKEEWSYKRYIWE